MRVVLSQAEVQSVPLAIMPRCAFLFQAFNCGRKQKKYPASFSEHPEFALFEKGFTKASNLEDLGPCARLELHKEVLREAANLVEELISEEAEAGSAPVSRRTRLEFLSHIGSLVAGQRHVRSHHLLSARPSASE